MTAPWLRAVVRSGAWAFLLAIGIAGGTGLGSMILGRPLRGVVLLAHMFGAGLFVLGAPIWAVTTLWLAEGPLRRVARLTAIVAALVVAVSALGLMSTLFDTAGMDRVLLVHAVASVVLVAAVLPLFPKRVRRGP